MQISFTTKEESNKKREEEFLSLSGSERFLHFIDLCQAMYVLPSKSPSKKNQANFIIKLYK